MKRIILGFLLILAAQLCACGGREHISYADEVYTYEETEALDSESESKASLRTENYVYVTGCVACPGVYIMPEGSRVYDAINAAGGVTSEGDESQINLVNIIHDGERIVVPSIQESCEEEESDHSKMVNINRATENQLTSIPGIGPAKAKAIIAYRDKYGPFSKVEDIMKVAGIKEGTFEKIKDFIEAN